MDAMTINTAVQPTMTGCENRNCDITVATNSTKPHRNAVGGPRREWNNLSETNPPANPPMIPKMQRNQPQ